MRKHPLKFAEKGRVRYGSHASKPGDRFGAFQLLYTSEAASCGMLIIADDGSDWKAAGLSGEPFEHVSVSLHERTPTWEELEYVRNIFWTNEETVMQLHVPAADHVNQQANTLHLWRPTKTPIPRPLQKCV